MGGDGVLLDSYMQLCNPDPMIPRDKLKKINRTLDGLVRSPSYRLRWLRKNFDIRPERSALGVQVSEPQ